jgi:hypothetical protein
VRLRQLLRTGVRLRQLLRTGMRLRQWLLRWLRHGVQPSQVLFEALWFLFTLRLLDQRLV